MATAAYVAVKDGSTTLTFGGDIDEDFPFDADGVDPGVQSVLSFIVTPSVDDADGDGDVELEMDLNGTRVVSQRFTSDQGRAWHEIVKKNLLKAKDNTLTARVTDADKNGKITIGDILLTYTNA